MQGQSIACGPGEWEWVCSTHSRPSMSKHTHKKALKPSRNRTRCCKSMASSLSRVPPQVSGVRFACVCFSRLHLLNFNVIGWPAFPINLYIDLAMATFSRSPEPHWASIFVLWCSKREVCHGLLEPIFHYLLFLIWKVLLQTLHQSWVARCGGEMGILRLP